MKNEGASSSDVPEPVLKTDFAWLGERYQGKVRDSYRSGAIRVLIATDRLSAFDRQITSVPGKGQVLTSMAQFWFSQTGHIVENHVIAVPDPSVMVVRNVEIIPIEVVVRGYLAGSAWRDYKEGRAISGVVLPAGLQEFEQLASPIITPSTKEVVGSHDLPISEAEVVARGLATGPIWEQVRSAALALFDFASKHVAKRGLLLADTKYEFGLLGDRVVLADEVHTLDCSRFWVAASYHERVRSGLAPEMLDKEPVRRWLMAQGFSGEGEVPQVPDQYRMELREYYKASAERITGEPMVFDDREPISRISDALKRFFSENGYPEILRP
jgi:phosphoribosylaminoimidazole-succinocarboxamide synthase